MGQSEIGENMSRRPSGWFETRSRGWFETIRPADKTGAHRVRVEPSRISDGAFLTMGQDGEWTHAHLSTLETRQLIEHLQRTIGDNNG